MPLCGRKEFFMTNEFDCVYAVTWRTCDCECRLFGPGYEIPEQVFRTKEEADTYQAEHGGEIFQIPFAK